MKHDASVHVSVELKERLDALSRRVRRDVSDITAEALNEYLDAAEREASDLFVSNEAMMDWLNSWGMPDERKAPEADIRKSA
ncbi:MAG: ribbon-helix-helix domain-containing protein [Alphaproteobacteria bacterium]|nr:ribbon-helix-helix protein, CopG family [Rhizobiaceae bacterium]MBU3961276.1 ribbon-helix-helix domain-containing protein [Alphaproteobacteria bacterium]MBU4052158.1 ribbon-helix-helix domain-containing protein [Alphaproteobacteria bacterium]MBU4087588.1 ribbon-helix-helix domain-containing protein [Alphaproteobacteria bacterium]MBU4157619.1 ribbon-helix-helix domain-containing protein [Alphaproteobacteria bacterium]